MKIFALHYLYTVKCSVIIPCACCSAQLPEHSDNFALEMAFFRRNKAKTEQDGVKSIYP